MANLLSISRLNNSARGADAVGIMLSKSPLMNFLDQRSGFEVDAHDFDWRPANAASSLQTRARGGAYTATDVTLESKQSGSLYLHGDRLDIDVTDLADQANGLRNIPKDFEKRLKKELINFAKAYEIKLFNGTGSGSPAQIKGLKTILSGTDDLPGYSGVTRVVNAADYSVDTTPKSLDLSLGGSNFAKNREAFMEALDYCLSLMSGDAGILCNQALFSRISSIARAQKVLGQSDEFGVSVPTYNGVPLIKTVPNAILSTEPDDADTPVEETTSLYLLSPAELDLSLVTNSGLEYWEYNFQEAKESGQEKWEIRAAWKVETPEHVLRLRNIKLG